MDMLESRYYVESENEGFQTAFNSTKQQKGDLSLTSLEHPPTPLHEEV